MSLPDQVLRVMRQHNLIPQGGTLVVGVSGGADSLALLHILHSLGDTLGCRLHAATLDHRLRGEASADDARFVAQICALWGIPVTVGQADVERDRASLGIGVEEAARAARYDFLAQAARSVGATHVAVAHQADDQAETVLMHLLRGSGLTGLGGMAFAAPLPNHTDLWLVRPLLTTTREQIEDYCHKQRLEPREDATNADTAYLRNRLRHKVLPLLQTINPRVKQVLTQYADIAHTENHFITWHADFVFWQQTARQEGRLSLQRSVFADLHPALQRRWIAQAAGQLAPEPENEVGYTHVLAALNVALTGQVGAQAVLPGGLRLRVDYEALIVERTDAPIGDAGVLLLPNQLFPVTIPGETKLIDGWTLRADVQRVEGMTYHARLAIPDGSIVSLRPRQDGDRFAPFGLDGHTRKINRWMIDRKIPQAIRDHIGLMLVDGAIAAIMIGEMWTISEHFAVHHDTPRVVYFRLARA